jgi:hypothetical protein
MPSGGELEPIAAQLFGLGPLRLWGGFDYQLRVAGTEGRVWREPGVAGEGEAARWSTVHYRLPLRGAVPTLTLDLRPENGAEQEAVQRGLAVDVEVGDRAFDRAFVVEAAPAEAVRALLDEPTRAALVTLAPCRLTLADGALHVSKGPIGEEPGEYERAVETIARMVHLCGVVQQRIQRLPVEMARGDQATGYRGTSPVRAHEEETAAAAEVAAVRDTRARREERKQARDVAIAIGVVVAALAALVAALLGR